MEIDTSNLEEISLDQVSGANNGHLHIYLWTNALVGEVVIFLSGYSLREAMVKAIADRLK